MKAFKDVVSDDLILERSGFDNVLIYKCLKHSVEGDDDYITIRCIATSWKIAAGRRNENWYIRDLFENCWCNTSPSFIGFGPFKSTDLGIWHIEPKDLVQYSKLKFRSQEFIELINQITSKKEG